MTVLEASRILQLQPNGVIRLLNLPSPRAEMLYVFHVGDSVAGWFFFLQDGVSSPMPNPPPFSSGLGIGNVRGKRLERLIIY